MNENEKIRYPHSATLFQFSKEILARQSPKQKVCDQEVGVILSFDPADCTHWKHGRKNIRSIKSINTLAKHLGVDARILMDITNGQLPFDDALKEYNGYGTFTNADKTVKLLATHAAQLIKAAQINALPVYPQEILDVLDLKNEQLQPCHTGNERFEQFKYLVSKYTKTENFIKAVPEVVDEALLNTFTLFLLMPTHLLQLAWTKCDPAFENLEQLSRFFWLGRSLVNIRIKYFMAHGV